MIGHIIGIARVVDARQAVVLERGRHHVHYFMTDQAVWVGIGRIGLTDIVAKVLEFQQIGIAIALKREQILGGKKPIDHACPISVFIGFGGGVLIQEDLIGQNT